MSRSRSLPSLSLLRLMALPEEGRQWAIVPVLDDGRQHYGRIAIFSSHKTV